MHEFKGPTQKHSLLIILLHFFLCFLLTQKQAIYAKHCGSLKRKKKNKKKLPVAFRSYDNFQSDLFIHCKLQKQNLMTSS